MTGVPQPCRIESLADKVVVGEMLGFDPVERKLLLRTASGGPTGFLAFAGFRRMTLTDPLRPAPRIDGAPRERVPAAAQERDYTLHAPAATTRPAVTGRTAGHVEAAEGMYLFAPVESELALQRIFVPRSAYATAEFGASADEVASRLWIGSPAELLDALERQHSQPVLPLGHSLMALGLLTQRQLDHALATPKGSLPLGERLVHEGLVSAVDLKTALAHKMGHPLIDLRRFPIDPAAMALLPQRVAANLGVMPLMLDRGRLIAAVETPARTAELRDLQAYVERPVVSVLAPRSQILTALYRLSGDAWKENVAQRIAFAATKP
ncbi:MAG: hypothetical protein ABIR94_04760 [Rubrivivax sp.]